MSTTEEIASSTSVEAGSAALSPPGSGDPVDKREQPALQPPNRTETSGRVEPQAAVTGRRLLIGREVLVYLAEQGQLDVDAFNLLGFWNRRGAHSICPTTTSSAEMPYLAFIARLYHGITSCQAERFFSALAHLIGDLRSRKLASKVKRMMSIRLNRHLIDEVRELDATVAQVRARPRVRRNPLRCRRRGRTCRLTLPNRYHE